MILDPTHIITKGPHLLFVGSNGNKTYGITIKHLDEEYANRTGRKVEYSLNDYTLLNCDSDAFLFLGKTIEYIENLQAEIKKMKEEQK